jgi:hypothetical protein
LAARLHYFIGNRVYRAGQFGVRYYRLSGDHHLRPVASAAKCDFSPDASAGTGDENCFAAQIIHCQDSI